MTLGLANKHLDTMQINFKLFLIFFVLMSGIFLSPNRIVSIESFYKKGFDLSIEDKTEASIQAYLNNLKTNPTSAETHHYLGMLYFKLGSGTKAIDYFKKAELLYQDRKDKEASFNLIILKNNLEKAYKELGLNPGDFKIDSLLPTEEKWDSSGVGFLVGRQGHIFTSGSSLQNTKKIRVRFPNGQTASAKIVRRFVVYKIAILQLINTANVKADPISFEDNPSFREGNLVYAIDFEKLATSNPFIIKGKILKENALENSDKIIQLDLPIKKGENGGPLFNKHGKLIGLTLTKFLAQKSYPYLKETPDNASFAIKSSYLEKIYSVLVNRKYKREKNKEKSSLHPNASFDSTIRDSLNNFVFLETSN